MVSEEKYFSCYVLSPHQILLFGCLHFVIYWAICVSQLFVNQVVTSQTLKLTLNESLESTRFFYMTKKSRQKFKYLENEKSF